MPCSPPLVKNFLTQWLYDRQLPHPTVRPLAHRVARGIPESGDWSPSEYRHSNPLISGNPEEDICQNWPKAEEPHHHCDGRTTKTDRSMITRQRLRSNAASQIAPKFPQGFAERLQNSCTTPLRSQTQRSVSALSEVVPILQIVFVTAYPFRTCGSPKPGRHSSIEVTS